jgi:peptide/nickel transport system permease protein
VASAVAAAAPTVRPAGQWTLAWRRLRRDKLALVCGAVLVVVAFGVIAGPTIAARLLGHGPNDLFPYAVHNYKPADPWTRVPDTDEIGAGSLGIDLPPPPKGTGTTLLVLGADGALGRDEFLRLLYGGRVSLLVAAGATLLALLIGSILGLIAAYFGGLADSVVSRFTDLVMAFPLLLFIIMLGSTVGDQLNDVTLGFLNKGVISMVLLIGVFTWFYPARIVRAQILSLREREFVEAAEMIGASDWRIMRRHLLPHLAGPLLAFGTIAFATNIMLEAGITFLGVGIEAPTPSWGTMLADTWGTLTIPSRYNPNAFDPWLTIIPSATILVTVVALNIFGESLRDALDPKRLR